jgi:hypothetical protein
MKHYSIPFTLFLLLALASFGFAEEETIDTRARLEDGSQLKSERFDARFVGDGFMISDKQLRGEPVHLSSMPPVYRAAWTGDGQTLATIEHVAGGSDFACFHFDPEANKWFRMNVVPDGNYWRYWVENWNVGRDNIILTYKVETEKNEEITSNEIRLKIDRNVFARFFESFGGREPFAGIVALSPAGTLRKIPCDSMNGRGTLKIDTDGSGSAHSDPTHQDRTSAMKGGDGTFVPRRDPPPPGYKELNADQDRYGVAPKNCAKVNGGPLEVGKQMDVDPANHKKDRIQIGDFGPDNQHGEVSYAEIGSLGYQIKQTSHGPYPWDGSSSADIPVDVTCHP